MVNILKKLSSDLKNLGYTDASSMVDMTKEDFEDKYKEEIDELGSGPISEPEYLGKNIASPPPSKDSSSTLDHQMRAYHKILDDVNFKPIQLNNFETIEIGKGFYGTVFSGIYNGKDAAIKIELDPEGSTEIDAWNKIISIKNFLPDKFKKYIPDVYLLKRGRLDTSDDLDSETLNSLDEEELMSYQLDYSAVVMERLYPSRKNLASLFDTQRDGDLGYAKSSFTSFNGWSKVSDDIYKILSERFYNKYFSYSKILSKGHFKNLYPLGANISEKPQLAYILSKKIADLVIGDGKIYYDKFKNDRGAYAEFIHEIGEDIYKDLVVSFEIFTSKVSSFPAGYSSISDESYNMYGELEDNFDKSFWKDEPNLGGLYEFLRYLATEYKILFEDLHGGNIMQNKDGQFKIIDLGLWDFQI